MICFIIKKTLDTANFRGCSGVVGIFYFERHTANYSDNGERTLISPKLETRTIILGRREYITHSELLLLWMADGRGSIRGGAKSKECDEEMVQTLAMDRHSKPSRRLRGLLWIWYKHGQETHPWHDCRPNTVLGGSDVAIPHQLEKHHQPSHILPLKRREQWPPKSHTHSCRRPDHRMIHHLYNRCCSTQYVRCV